MSDSFELALIPANVPIPDTLWKCKDGRLIPVKDIPDGHLRNIALMLIDMGYQRVHPKYPKELRVAWLRILRKEWKRRMKLRSEANIVALEVLDGTN